MKHSPRTWLLTRHTAATPALDAARRTALRDFDPVPIAQLLPAIFRPHRHLWSILAAVWALLAVLHFSRPSVPADTSRSTVIAATWFSSSPQLHALLAQTSPRP